ncbi:hypothetical protein NKG05_28515 [Oerskovia sp. M15]
MSGPSEPRPVGNVLWLALGSFVLAVLLVATGAPCCRSCCSSSRCSSPWSVAPATCGPGAPRHNAPRRDAPQSHA